MHYNCNHSKYKYSKYKATDNSMKLPQHLLSASTAVNLMETEKTQQVNSSFRKIDVLYDIQRPLLLIGDWF